ncbi:hypothetical protein F7725_025109 [Dissostichus mawsoni]|uniref:Stathmin-4 n=1 Tax=Dissostichus mawsoni TaxID=36200 RepID=A0A7J5XA78_DISMA|nr:hypothetical protein F7725_025109 [Dissostichus mawsoni]
MPITTETKRETPTLLRTCTLHFNGTLDLSGLWLGGARQGIPSHRDTASSNQRTLLRSTRPRHHQPTEMAKTAIAYKEKMKEISVFSLICSCLYPETRKNLMGDFEDLDIKPINKRASGQSFEIILKPTSPVSDNTHCITTPPKRDISLEDIQKKLEAAEDRRKSQEAQVLQALAEKREHERDVLMKAMEENSNFSRMAEEKLQVKMEQIEENRQAYMAAIMDRLQEKERHAQEVRRNKELREEGFPTLDVGMGALRAEEGDMMGKALKGKGNAERVERRGLESLDADEETKAGCWWGGPGSGPDLSEGCRCVCLGCESLHWTRMKKRRRKM